MDCKEFRHMVTGDPSTADGEAHVDDCADCRAYVDEINALDLAIQRAMAIDVPALDLPELPEIDTAKVTTLAGRRRVSAPAWLATAAAVALVAVLGVRSFTTDSYESLADEIVAHMDHEPYALRVTSTPVSDRQLAQVVPANVANLSHDAGLITYAQSCKINGNTVPHLVIQGENGPVTILLLPDEKIERATPLEGESIHGVLIPVGGGSIAIIGDENRDSLERIEQSLKKSVSWQT